MLINQSKKHIQAPLIYPVTLNVPRYIKVDQSQKVTCKSEHFDFTDVHYYLKDALYKVTLTTHGGGVYLKKEIIKNE